MFCCSTKSAITSDDVPSLRCTAITLKGQQCKKLASGDNKLCDQHKSMAKKALELSQLAVSGDTSTTDGSAPDVRNAGGRLKSRVFLRIRGVENLKFVEKKIAHLVRDASISSMREKVLSVRGEEAFYTSTSRLGPRTRSMTNAAADAALDAAIAAPVGSTKNRQTLHVDHTFECQQLAHCIVQTEAFHEENAILLSSIDINVGSDVLSRQPMVVRHFLSPLYKVQNCVGDQTLFNLRLLDDSLNETKGQTVKNFIQSRYNSKKDHVGLRSGFRACAAVKDGRITREDADELATKLSKEMALTSDTYCKRLEEKGKLLMYTIYASPAARSQQDRRIDGLSESIKNLCAELEENS